MQGKIALEEHFAIPETLMDSAGFVPESYWPELRERLLDYFGSSSAKATMDSSSEHVTANVNSVAHVL